MSDPKPQSRSSASRCLAGLPVAAEKGYPWRPGVSGSPAEWTTWAIQAMASGTS